ncbi:MAG: hypothetical protein FWF70_08190 [Bacteroidetes bacterium]|nr:hypothetical protein [Bacteroidota bacterium]MCL1968231.1 hypothetical protein [Bacteroidota bacterium]
MKQKTVLFLVFLLFSTWAQTQNIVEEYFYYYKGEPISLSLDSNNVYPFFERGDAPPIGTSDIFYLKLKARNDTALLRNIAEQLYIQIIKEVPYMPLWYILSIRNSVFENSIVASNFFYETGYFEDVDPAFMFNFQPNCTNDPKFFNTFVG